MKAKEEEKTEDDTKDDDRPKYEEIYGPAEVKTKNGTPEDMLTGSEAEDSTSEDSDSDSDSDGKKKEEDGKSIDKCTCNRSH